MFARVLVQDEGVLGAVMLEKFKQFTPRKACTINGLKWCGLKGGSWDSAWVPSDRILHLADGSFIEFKTYKQDRQSHGGAQRHFVWFDEEPPLDINEENLARQTTTGINAIYTFTPLNYAQWSYRSLYQRAATDPDVAIIFVPTSDNAFVDKDTLKFLEETYTDPAERAARLEGRFTFLEGLVYKEYGDHNLVEPWEIPYDYCEYSLVIDPHEQKATAWNIFAEEPNGRLYVIDEGDTEGDVEYISQTIISRFGGRRMSLVLCDPSARRRAQIRNHNERMIDEFRRYFPQMLEANNNVDVGISRVRAAVKPIAGQRPMLCVCRTCPVTDHQMRNISWRPPLKSGEDRSKPIIYAKENDHPDCVRYRKMHQPIFEGINFTGFGMQVYGR